MKRLSIAFAAAALQMLLATDVPAHTALASSSPASGSVLAESPAVLSLTFVEPVRLTSMVLVTTAGVRKLQFAPSGSAAKFTVTRPDLLPGRNEVRWNALSRDGHVIEGAVIVVLRTPTPKKG